MEDEWVVIFFSDFPSMVWNFEKLWPYVAVRRILYGWVFLLLCTRKNDFRINESVLGDKPLGRCRFTTESAFLRATTLDVNSGFVVYIIHKTCDLKQRHSACEELYFSVHWQWRRGWTHVRC